MLASPLMLRIEIKDQAGNVYVFFVPAGERDNLLVQMCELEATLPEGAKWQ